jgi:AraC-like DNA-binding protein
VVHRFWTLRGPAPAGSVEFQRAMPDGRPEIIFNIADRFERRRGAITERQAAPLLIGPTTTALEVRPSGRVDLVGVRLAPGRWPALLGVVAPELLDRTIPLPEVGGPWREDLLEPLAEAHSDAARLALVETRLLRALRRDPRRNGGERLQAAVDLTTRGEVRRVSRVAEQAGVSTRQLARLFRESTGMSPKLLAELARFQTVLAALEQPTPVRWAALAYRHGYYDQAHLARDFRRFGGISPGAYLKAARELTRNFVEGVSSSSG